MQEPSKPLPARLPILLLLVFLLASAAVQARDGLRTLDWTDLIPEDDLKMLEKNPSASLDYYSDKTATGMSGTRGKLPGYVVPISNNAKGKVTEFFFVPYFGACIHMPPPPPNQIIHVKPKTPVDQENLWDAVWIVGTLRTGAVENAMARSAYSFDLEKVEPMEDAGAGAMHSDW